jgi:hypothetical protein
MSNNPYRTMCADMLEAFDGLPCETNYRGQSRPIVWIDEEPFDRARALLAQPEPEGLTEQELWQIWDDIDSTIPDILRAAIAADCARYGRPTPQPPAAGEVAELVWVLHKLANANQPSTPTGTCLLRAAALLQRQRPQPVAVSERPWEREGWCDDEGRCWLRRKYEKDGVTWRLMAPASLFNDAMPIYYAEALPANAIPTPENTND